MGRPGLGDLAVLQAIGVPKKRLLLKTLVAETNWGWMWVPSLALHVGSACSGKHKHAHCWFSVGFAVTRGRISGKKSNQCIIICIPVYGSAPLCSIPMPAGARGLHGRHGAFAGAGGRAGRAARGTRCSHCPRAQPAGNQWLLFRGKIPGKHWDSPTACSGLDQGPDPTGNYYCYYYFSNRVVLNWIDSLPWPLRILGASRVG